MDPNDPLEMAAIVGWECTSLERQQSSGRRLLQLQSAHQPQWLHGRNLVKHSRMHVAAQEVPMTTVVPPPVNTAPEPTPGPEVAQQHEDPADLHDCRPGPRSVSLTAPSNN